MRRESTDSGESQRPQWSPAGAGASAQATAPRLARLARPAGHNPRPLARVPRSSVSPPASAQATQLSPTPIFEDDVELLEDSGLLTLEPDQSAHIEELSASFLIDEEARAIVPRLALPPKKRDDVDDIDELPANELAFVETRGEISAGPKALPTVTKGPKVKLVSLHEQALADGIAHYSDGVPAHDLARASQISHTLRIRATSATVRGLSIRTLSMGLALVCGLAVAAYFTTRALDTSSASAVTSAPLSAASPVLLAQSEIASTSAQESVTSTDDSPDPLPVVMPLVEELGADVEAEVASADTELGVAELEVAELGVAELSSETNARADSEQGDDVEAQAGVLSSRDQAGKLAERERELVENKTRSKAQPRTSEMPEGKRATGTADPGVLMLAAKPPCGITIDGKDTGLMTPQRVLHLSPGTHKVTLVNVEHDLRESFQVSIKSGAKTKVIRDMSSKLK